MHSLGRDCHFNLSFFARDSPFACKRKFGVICLPLGEWGYIFLLSAVRRRACTLFFFIYAYEISVRDRGICAYDMIFLLEMDECNRLEAEGNVQSSGLGSILEWVRLAWP
jgi:hypothetical protein